MPTIKPGTKFSSGFADSMATWEVKRSRGRGVWECEITADNPDYAGVTEVFDTRTISAALAREDFFARAERERDEFWDAQTVGDILHYENRHTEWVRGEVVLDTNGQKAMKAIALVGDWQSYDLPRRQRDGSISYPYHAKSVVEGKVGRYNVIYEQKLARGQIAAGSPDPRTMDPIDLTVPPMDDEAEETARLEQLRQKLQEQLNNPDVRLALNNVRRLLTPDFVA